ncbi:MAG: 3'-5' exonuclease [Bacteroidales bacterium]|nr:3'-5' exonuclease [Bacteroidales bacterium]
MELNLTRPLLFFDIESTGLNIASDCIAELSFVKVLPGGETRIKTWRFLPWNYVTRSQQPMHPAASAVNGIKDADLVGCPRFCDKVDEVIEWLADSDLAGFNSAKFDLPMLAEEIERVRVYLHRDLDIDLHGKLMVDVQNIYHYMEPRNLKAAYRFYCGGEDFENAHTAEADTIATYKVLKGQLDMYGDRLKNDVASLASVAGRPKTVDYAGRLIYNEAGEVVISFGKHKGRTAREVWASEPSYFAWIDGGDFTLDTKRQFARLKQQFLQERRAAMNRPATADELAGLKDKFNGGKLF